MKSLLKVIPLHKNESALINKAIKHNREAQRVLFEMHAPKMLSVCRYYIKDIHQAEEAMLNGFFKVFKNLKSFKGKGSFGGWIRRIMVRESISYLRYKKQVEFLSDADVSSSDNSASIQTDLEVNDIQKLIDDLPEGYRVVFMMYAVEGYKHHEIADALNISEGTSKSQLFKARKMLQEQIKIVNKTNYGTH
ncbi:RNA polymerase sigma factor [Hyunsoonleella aquatilis]|uniref:RNA polymerase sigma factor n=1 Tax=Hyunsoonleella aquatilis TaxID=2762758 RepID=UPI001FEC6BE8|nr:RNA polymerase sigma factor [Hyunsoonleella aquatilis]